MPGPLWKSDRACVSTKVEVSPKSSTARGAVTIPVMLVLSLGLQWDFMVALVGLSLMANIMEESLCDSLPSAILFGEEYLVM